MKETRSLEVLVRRVMVRMALADGELRDEEVARLRWTVGRLTGAPPTEAEVRTDIEEIQGRPEPLPSLLRRVRDGLDAEQRRTVLQAAYVIATADGRVPDVEDALMVDIARALEIGPQEYRRLLSPLALARSLDA